MISARPSKGSFALLIACALIMSVVAPFVAPVEASHGEEWCLDVENGNPTPDDPSESESNPQGTTHTVTAILRSQVPPPGPADDDACNGAETQPGTPLQVNFEITGANDPDATNSVDSPDRTCFINATSTRCSSTPWTGTNVGTDRIRGWIDFPGVTTAAEVDETEGLNDTNPAQVGEGDHCSLPAPPAEPDCTDVVEKQWTGEASLDCDDANGPDTEREINPSGQGTQSGSASNETYTCTALTGTGAPENRGEDRVFGEVENGVNDPDPDAGENTPSYNTPDYSCQPGTNGQCTIEVRQLEGESGTAEICFWYEEDSTPSEGATLCADEPTGENQAADGSDAGNDRADQVEKTWEASRAAAVDVEPETDTNTLGTNHTLTATVFNQFGQQFQGQTTVYFEFFQGSPTDGGDGNTPNAPDRMCTTPQNGSSCQVSYSQTTTAGTDVICGYLDQNPSTAAVDGPPMTGSNTSNPQCGDEGLNDPGDDPGVADAPQGQTDDEDVVQKTWQPPTAAAQLDCEPETDSNDTGQSHTVTCTARNSAGQTVANANIDVEATGANDPDGNADGTTPDFTCTTGSNGSCSFTHGPGGTGTTTQSGTTTYRAWIDSDNNNNSVDADPTEGQNENTQPGSRSEPDDTDVVTKTWAGEARTIDCEPETDTNETGTSHTVTCTVRDRAGQPSQGIGVTFTESGPGSFTSSTQQTTNQNGQAQATVTSNETGDQTITGTITESTQNEPDTDECNRAAGDPAGAPAGQCSDSVTKTWQEDVDGDGPTRGPCANTGPFGSEVDTDNDGDPDVFIGTDGDDVLTGTDEDDIICGLAGNDIIDGLAGDDLIAGNQGADTIDGGDGDDELRGGFGRDDMHGRGGSDLLKGAAGVDSNRGGGQNDVLRGGNQNDTNIGGFGDDTLIGGGDQDTMRGNRGNDVLRGNKDRDDLLGGPGNDNLIGGEGIDTLRGGTGNDTIRGSQGNDRLFGGPNDDSIVGGRGFDRCRGGRGSDTIRQCEA